MERIAVFDVEFSVPGRIAFDSDAERVRARRQRLVVFERMRVVHPGVGFPLGVTAAATRFGLCRNWVRGVSPLLFIPAFG